MSGEQRSRRSFRRWRRTTASNLLQSTQNLLQASLRFKRGLRWLARVCKYSIPFLEGIVKLLDDSKAFWNQFLGRLSSDRDLQKVRRDAYQPSALVSWAGAIHLGNIEDSTRDDVPYAWCYNG